MQFLVTGSYFSQLNLTSSKNKFKPVWLSIIVPWTSCLFPLDQYPEADLRNSNLQVIAGFELWRNSAMTSSEDETWQSMMHSPYKSAHRSDMLKNQYFEFLKRNKKRYKCNMFSISCLLWQLIILSRLVQVTKLTIFNVWLLLSLFYFSF